MEVLSMLKHWRGGGGGVGGGAPEPPPSAVTACVNAHATATTIATSALPSSTETEDEDGDDEGPFFDLEFSVPEEDADGDEVDVGESDDSVAESEEQGGGERELNHTISSERSARLGSLISDPGFSLSPSDDLFFKPSSQPKPPGAKLQIFLLGFKKLKSGTAETGSRKQQRQRQGKIKSFVVEEVPIVSLFTRDSRTRSYGRPAKLHPDDAAPPPEEKRSSKDALHRYLSKIKPFYVRVSKRHSEKQGFSGPLSSAASDAAGTRPSPAERPHGGGNLQAGLRVVCRRLGKSRSASSAVPVVRSPSRRRDDSSLLELQDGIQSAIAHCKRSFNAGTESSMVRSRSDPGDERAAPPVSSTERSNF